MTNTATTCSAFLLGAATAAACAAPAMGTQSPAPSPESGASRQPREFGAVQWQRRIDPALEEAERFSKPALVLFQEVPG